MIGYIRGRITGLFQDFAFIEAGGIGYQVYMSDRDRQMLHTGEEARVLTYLAVREDAMTLYGFMTQEEHDLFLLLISVAGIGPKGAMGILSAASASSFSLAVRKKDIKALMRLPGVGKRTAERLVLELKDKLGSFGADEDMEESAGEVPLEGTGPLADAAAALASLGYREEEIRPALRKVAGTSEEAAALIGAALRELGKERN